MQFSFWKIIAIQTKIRSQYVYQYSLVKYYKFISFSKQFHLFTLAKFKNIKENKELYKMESLTPCTPLECSILAIFTDEMKSIITNLIQWGLEKQMILKPSNVYKTSAYFNKFEWLHYFSTTFAKQLQQLRNLLYYHYMVNLKGVFL